jgi:hypothetical protein
MGDRNRQRTKKTCGRPFKAPRPVKQSEKDIVGVPETELQDSVVQIISKTANDGDIEGRQETVQSDGSSDSDDNVPDDNVTGFTYGTASKPKFPLMEVWTTVLFPELDALVKPGGPCVSK